ncbi:MAG: glycosyltransferase family 9 protein, partial [Planctomycetes bacterium]|nr:glycosyltransferase family 9 protein [Planctomycetota bacterium]
MVLFPHSLRSAFLAYLSGARWRLGYATEARGCLLTHPVPVTLDSKTVHAVDYYLPLVAPLGVTRVEKNFRSMVTEEDMRLYAKNFLDLGIRKDDFVVAVQPGASKPQKRWHAERFGVLCQRLVREKNVTIVLLGSKDEKQDTKEGTVEHWGRSSSNPIRGWYGLKKNFKGRFGMYRPPLMEE